MREQCEHLKANGERCKAAALDGFHLCYFHDDRSGAAEARKQARQAGGRARSKPAAVLGADVADLSLGSIAEVVSMLAATINEVRRGQLDCKIANAIGYLASVLIRGITDGNIEARLAALEQRTFSSGRTSA